MNLHWTKKPNGTLLPFSEIHSTPLMCVYLCVCTKSNAGPSIRPCYV